MPGPLEPQALARYVRDPDNGLVQRAERRGLLIDLQYRPASLAALQNLGGRVRGDSSYAAALADAQQFSTFEMVMQSSDGQSIAAALERLTHAKDSVEVIKNYFYYTVQQDLWLHIGPDSLPCAFYHPLADGGLRQTSRSLVAFEVPDNLRLDMPIRVRWRTPLLGSQPIDFAFDPSSFNNIPALAL